MGERKVPTKAHWSDRFDGGPIESTDDENERLAAELEALRAERDRYREAVGRLRDALVNVSVYADDRFDVPGMTADVLDATTDEAIQGYDEPQPGDAALLAKANAAIGAQLDAANAEIARLRALADDGEQPKPGGGE